VNWLAHVFLSEPDVQFRLGNLLADLVRGEDRVGMSQDFLRGAQCHKAIDSFTDAHPVVRRSRSRLGAEHRRFSGVFIDVFYDYFLATDWDRYSPVPLVQFTADFYADVATTQLRLPDPARATLDRIVKHDLLGQYRQIEGVERSLRRLSAYLTSRWRKPFALDQGVAVLLANERELAGDFAEFFPQLQSHVAELSL
jgi:acyl carrier protein phosphodiesterase